MRRFLGNRRALVRLSSCVAVASTVLASGIFAATASAAPYRSTPSERRTLAKLDRVAAQPTPSVAKLKAANSDPDAHLGTTPRPDSILDEAVLEMIKTSSVTSPWGQFTGPLGYRDFYKEPKLTGNEAPGTLLKVQKFPMQLGRRSSPGPSLARSTRT